MKKAIIRNKLKELLKDKPVRMHMPGHKGKNHRYKYDVTEIVGADNLHDPQGIIKEAQDKVADIYGADESVFLVDGTTAGLQASILSAVNQGEKILIPINAHRSVYPAIGFSQADPVYYKPEILDNGMIVTPEIVRNLISEHPDAKAILIVSPDFYGNISDLKEISKILKDAGIALIVDEAHGAHLKFLPGELDAVTSGADYVVQSTHKILGSPTQSSILHLNGLADKKKVKKLLGMIESSSPSYMFMAGLEDAVDEANSSAKKKFKKIYSAHEAIMKSQNEDDPIQLLEPSKLYDKSKFLYSVPNAYSIQEKLIEELRIIPELISGDTILFMTGIGTSQRDINRLFGAINILNNDLKEQGIKPVDKKSTVDHLIKPFDTEKSIIEVLNSPTEIIPLEETKGKVLASFVIPYPPGIPLLIPGSKISQEDIDNIKELVEKNFVINGLEIKDDQVFLEVVES